MAEEKVIIARREDCVRRLAFNNALSVDDLLETNPHLKERLDPDLLDIGEPIKLVPAAGRPPTVGAGELNDFQADVPRLEVRLLLHDEKGPLKGERLEFLDLDGEDLPTETEGDGSVTFEVPVTVLKTRLFLPRRWRVLVIEVGALSPVESPLGMRQRLANLGCWPEAMRRGGSVELEPIEESMARWKERTGQSFPDLKAGQQALENASMKPAATSPPPSFDAADSVLV